MNRRNFFQRSAVALGAVASAPAIVISETPTSLPSHLPTIQDLKALAGDDGAIGCSEFVDYVQRMLPAWSLSLTTRPERQPLEQSPPCFREGHYLESLRHEIVENRRAIFCFDLLSSPERALDQINQILGMCYDFKVVVTTVQTENIVCGEAVVNALIGESLQKIAFPIPVDNSRHNKAVIYFTEKA